SPIKWQSHLFHIEWRVAGGNFGGVDADCPVCPGCAALRGCSDSSPPPVSRAQQRGVRKNENSQCLSNRHKELPSLALPMELLGTKGVFSNNRRLSNLLQDARVENFL